MDSFKNSYSIKLETELFTEHSIKKEQPDVDCKSSIDINYQRSNNEEIPGANSEWEMYSSTSFDTGPDHFEIKPSKLELLLHEEIQIKVEVEDEPEEAKDKEEAVDEHSKHDMTRLKENEIVCGVFNYKRSERAHLKQHSGEKPFACDQCSYRSRQKSDLKRHVKIHSDEKPFSCDQCDYRSRRKSKLKEHQIIHSDEKPFSCNHCDYRCRQKSYLKRHQKIHSGEQPFACDQCSYRGRQKSDLKEHQTIHSGEKPFPCDLCDYRCRQKSNLKIHKRRNHLLVTSTVGLDRT